MFSSSFPLVHHLSFALNDLFYSLDIFDVSNRKINLTYLHMHRNLEYICIKRLGGETLNSQKSFTLGNEITSDFICFLLASLDI